MGKIAQERRLRLGGLAFFGRITASISHELYNYITIIGEVAGLLEDLCQIAETGRPIAPDKLRRQCDLIDKQLERLHVVIKQMNRFAHSADYEEESFDLVSELATTMYLSKRLAGIKGFRIEELAGAETATVTGHRFLFHELIFSLLSSIFESGARDGVIELAIEDVDGSPRVTITCEIDGSPDESRVDYARILAEELDSKLVVGPETNLTSFAIEFSKTT